MDHHPTPRLFLDVFSPQGAMRPPFWFMRQAGRYLPEYRAVREGCADFLSLCYHPEKATDVTLQPVRRFGMDAAIIFSDILVIPHAMGREVRFVKGEGPRLNPLEHSAEVEGLSLAMEEVLDPVYQALRMTRQELPDDKALIGFAGAPWTLACYMLEGKGGGEFEAARRMLYTQPELMLALVEKLTQAVAKHLVAQVKAGADALQLFDSWGGLVPAPWQEAMVFAPARRIVAEVKRHCPKVPIIGFPRGMGSVLGEYARATGVDGISIDSFTPLEAACASVPESCVVQGNLDPLLLAYDGARACAEATRLRQLMQGRRFIFNLGHGMIPETPVTHVEALVEVLKHE